MSLGTDLVWWSKMGVGAVFFRCLVTSMGWIKGGSFIQCGCMEKKDRDRELTRIEVSRG